MNRAAVTVPGRRGSAQEFSDSGDGEMLDELSTRVAIAYVGAILVLYATLALTA